VGCPKVLLADDNLEMRERIAQLLASDFDIVGQVADGQQAIDSALKLSPDILVTDISLPISNGIQVASQLWHLGCSVKVIFLTVHEDRDFIEAAFSIGAYGYVLKPCISTDLIPAIQDALQGRRFTSPLPVRQL
jgi:two-component system response regulator NreC